MAQTLLTNISSSLVIPNVLGGGFATPQFVQSTPWLNFLESQGRVIGPGGSGIVQVNATMSPYTINTHTEGDDTFTHDTEVFARLSASPFARRAQPGFSEEVLTNVENGGTYGNVILNGLQDAKIALRRKVEQDLLSATSEVGLEALVDDSNNCHGVAVATYSNWVSYENSQASSPLSISAMQSHWATVIGSTYDSAVNFVLMSPAMISAYTKAGGDSQGGSLGRVDPMANGRFDAGVMQYAKDFNGAVIVSVLDLTSTTIIFGDINHIALKVRVDNKLVELGATNFDKRYIMLWAGCQLIDRRKSFSKMTNISLT